MNAVTKIESAKPMLFDSMADKYGLTPNDLITTVKTVCGLKNASMPEVGAFLMVARQYDLNPVLKEIYAFPAKGGGIVPIVSIDGWVNLINSHPKCDGFEFEFEHNGKDLVSCTCRMFRKDRSRPVVVTEYFDECKRATDPWKMQHRMLRHKALIQAARYAFGFAGIYDEDEGAKIAEAAPMRASVTVMPPDPDAHAQIELQSSAVGSPPQPPAADDRAGGDVEVASPPDAGSEASDLDTPIRMTDVLAGLDTDLEAATDEAAIEEIYAGHDIEATLAGTETGVATARQIKARHVGRVTAAANRASSSDEAFQKYKATQAAHLATATKPVHVTAHWQQARKFREEQGFTASQIADLKAMFNARREELDADTARDD